MSLAGDVSGERQAADLQNASGCRKSLLKSKAEAAFDEREFLLQKPVTKVS
jgi:hypothetical protein